LKILRKFCAGVVLGMPGDHYVKSGPGIRQEAGTATHACEGGNECGG
jgi:hypothetical protein